MAPRADSITKIVEQLDAQLAELKPLIDEYERLEAARAVLLNGEPPQPRRSAPAGSPRRPAGTRRRARARRAPRGANREAILAYVADHPGASAAEISDATGIPRPTTHTTVSQLKRKGDLAPEGSGVTLPRRARR
jgi:sugar-specific transcriptional regulator TrmB